MKPLRSSVCAQAIAVVALLCPPASLLFLEGCGGSNSSTRGNSPTSDIEITVATNPPGMSSVFPAGMVQLVASVTGNTNTNVNWDVNGVPNGNSAVGTIIATGTGTALYTAPVTAPNPASVNITATCVADSSKSASLMEGIQPCTLNGTVGNVAPAPYVPPSGPSCDVSDVSTLQACAAAVRNGAASKIRFTAMVNCSGDGTCLIDLTNVNGPVTVFGAPGVAAGLLRTDTYTYPIVNINMSSAITIANLTFDEGPDDPACTPYQMNGNEVYPCESTIDISNSSNIVLEQVSLLHSKDHAIAASSTQGITVRDSLIDDAGVFGIWTGNSESSNVSITNNLIQNVKSNGIFLSLTDNTTINGNTLQHNHHVALFDVCGGLCPGGQIDMLDNSRLQIYSNQIINGQIDLNNATGQTGGIEITDQNTDVTITNNIVANNLGIGIGTNPAVTGTNFRITGNKIYNNGTNLYLLPGTGIQESGDCFTQ